MSLGKAGVHARRQTLGKVLGVAHAEGNSHEGLRLVTTAHALQPPVLVLTLGLALGLGLALVLTLTLGLGLAWAWRNRAAHWRPGCSSAAALPVRAAP